MAPKKSKSRKLKKPPQHKTDGQPASPLSRAWSALAAAAASRRLFWCCAVLLPVAVLAYYPSYRAFYSGYDTWFHLAYGKHFVQNLTWHIDPSVYSWTPASDTSMYNTWIGSSILYLTHKASGVHGLFALQYVVLAASGAIILRLARTACGPAGISLLTAILLAAITMGVQANSIRPEMFSILLLTLTAALYCRFRMAPGPWVIAAFPVLFFVWVNTHGLWQFGAIFLGLVFAIDLLLYIVWRNQAIDRSALAWLSGSAGLTFLALCINPHGIALPIGFIKGRFAIAFSTFFAGGGTGSGGQIDYYREVLEYQSMWQHLFFTEKIPTLTATALGMVAMLIAVLTLWAVSWRRSGRADLPVAAANVAFFLMGMYMLRLSLVFTLIWLPSMVFLAWRAGPQPILPKVRPLATAAFFLLCGYTFFASACFHRDPAWFGAGYQNYIPDKEVRYIMENELPGPIFNDYLSGSYMMWAMYPEYKVFIDTRQGPYRQTVFPDYTGIGTKFPLNAEGLDAFVEKYPFKTALVKFFDRHIIAWLHKSPDWTLLYFESNALVMVHRDILPTLSEEAKNAMHPPSHFKEIKNPAVLFNLFLVYNNFLGPHYAVQIRDIYEQNVSDLYWQKGSHLEGMNRRLATR